MLKKIHEFITGKQTFTLTDELKQCIDLIENSYQNLFITGKAGTGKSTLIAYVRSNTKKKIIVLSPTGLSAINVQGQTIHSFFHFPPRMITKDAIRRVYNDRIFKEIDTIIIDEISMVRADLLDGIDYFLRLHGKTKDEPFGGTQMIFIGDLYQLPPVLRREESDVFFQLYETPYFFSAKSFNPRNFLIIELSTIFRQKDAAFIDILNHIRVGNVTAHLLDPINKKHSEKSPPDRNAFITLTTTNAVATSINESELNKITEPLFTYTAVVEGDFPTTDTSLPAEMELKLKKGAKVMFVKNDKGRMYVNGTIGTVYELNNEAIHVRIEDASKSEVIAVPHEEWQHIKYELDHDTGEIKEKVVGIFRQFPLRLAWAITIHKSQGMTFDKVHIDFSRSPFTHGQTYVALSRCRTIDGIRLSKKIWPNDVIVDDRIVQFSKRY